MSEAPPERSVAEPRLFVEFQSSDSKWAGRIGFFVAGLGAFGFSFLASFWVVGALRSAGIGEPATYWVSAAVPAAFVMAVIGMRMRQGPRWRWISFTTGIALVPAPFVLAFVVAPWVESVVKTRAFDAAAWAGDGDPVASRRAWMVDDLLERHPLRGTTRVEVEALLGLPDFPDTTDGAGETVYILGVERQLGFMPEFEMLVIEYDSANRVTAVRVRSY